MVLIIYLCAAAVMAVVGTVFWIRARSTRHSRRCPTCGELVTVELMEAANCPCCGSALGPKEMP